MQDNQTTSDDANRSLWLGSIHQITWIPLIEYLSVFLLTGLIWLGLKLFGEPAEPVRKGVSQA